MTEFIYDLLYIVPLSLTAMLYWCGLFGVEERTFPMYALVLVPLLILDLFVHLKAKGRLLLFGLTAAVLLSVAFVVSRFMEEISLSDLPWLIPFLVISVISFILGFMTARSSLLRIVLPLMLITLLVLSLEVIEYPAGKGVFAAFFFVLICLSTEIHNRWIRFGDTDVKKHMVFTSPFILAIIFIASLFNCPDKPYDWKVFIAIWDRMTVAVDKLKFNFGPGNDTFMGFSDSGEIGAGVERTKQPKVVFEITTNADIDVPVYFSGTMYDSFNGHKWSNEKKTLENTRKMDSLETMISAKAGAEDHRDIIRDSAVNIKYLNMKTKYLFAPTKTSDYVPMSDNTVILEENGIYSFQKNNPYRFEAKEFFYRQNTDNPIFYEYMTASPAVTEKAWKSSLRTFGISKLEDNFGYDKYLEYKKDVKEKYSEEIVLSPALREKLDLLYEGAASDYEKMKRLEASLGLMRYTTDTDPIPESVESASDFLEYMLLDKKEGYCTHYATAFVLLARAEGLPARFVQGFRLSIGKAGTYNITSDMAHAWPEVYFEGKGWITFEPTPGFYEETSWLSVTNKMIKIEPTKPAEVFDEPDAPGSVKETVTEEEERIKINFYVFLIPIAAIIFVLSLFWVIGKAVSKHRYKKMPVKKKVMIIAKDIFATLSAMGLRPNEGETLQEFADRISGETGDEIYPFIDVYERVLYAKLQEKELKLSPVLTFHENALKLLKQKNIVKYVFKMLTSQV